jgi:uncharacterized protein YgiB involved in biofilm formation
LPVRREWHPERGVPDVSGKLAALVHQRHITLVFGEAKITGQRRKRSAAITLVLAGTISGCGEPVPQQDVYRSVTDCQRDWGDPQQCQPVRDNRYAPSYYYGPSHYGSSLPDGRPRPSANAMDAVKSTTPVSRRGFGSSSRSFSSSGS